VWDPCRLIAELVHLPHEAAGPTSRHDQFSRAVVGRAGDGRQPGGLV